MLEAGSMGKLLRRTKALAAHLAGGPRGVARCKSASPSSEAGFLATQGDFLEPITSRQLWARYEELFAARVDLQVLTYILGRPQILEWLHSVGVSEDPVLASLEPEPLPEARLHQHRPAPPLVIDNEQDTRGGVVPLVKSIADPEQPPRRGYGDWLQSKTCLEHREELRQGWDLPVEE